MRHMTTAIPFSFGSFLGLAGAVIAVSAAGTGPTRFPIDERGTRGVSSLENQWFGKILDRLREPSLFSTERKEATVYRFTLVPTWGNPISVRLTVTDGVGEIAAKRLDGEGGYEPGHLAEQGAAKLTKEATNEFTALFGKTHFSKLETRDKDGGKDGSEWILEAVKGGKYHVVVRWCPTEYDPEKRGTVEFAKVCKWLFQKSPLKADATNKGMVEIRKKD